MAISTDSIGPADLAAITKSNDSSWGGNWSSWIIIFLIFIMFGGFNGFGNNANTTSATTGVLDNYVLNSDFSTLSRQVESATSSLERKGDTINAGLCDGFYAMNTGLLNGFSNVNSTVQNTGYDLRNAIQNNQIMEMQNANAIQSQVAQGFCGNKEAISNVNYNLALNSNATQRAIDGVNYNAAINTAAINANIDNKFAQLQLDQKNAEIAAMQNQLNQLATANTIQAATAGVVKYPMASTYSSGANPFCSCNCGGYAN